MWQSSGQEMSVKAWHQRFAGLGTKLPLRSGGLTWAKWIKGRFHKR
jgi:hypothetical protein